MTGPQQLDPRSPDIAADDSALSEQQGGSSTTASVGHSAAGAVVPDETDRAVSPTQIRARHSRHLEELIDRGKGLAFEMFDDASNRTFEETRRIQFVRLADRLSETTRKLITTYDRHNKDKV